MTKITVLLAGNIPVINEPHQCDSCVVALKHKEKTMLITITPGLEEGRTKIELNALDILVNLRIEDFNRLKQIMELDVPGVVGPTTLTRFVELCNDLKIDLTDAGVNSFKEKNNLGNMGLMHGVIGPQTASFYYDAIHEKLEGFTPGETNQEINEEGLAIVKEFEGLHRTIPGQSGKVKAYLDPIGVPTIGYGHTEGVTLGQVITFEEAEALLRADLRESAKAVSSLVKVALTVNQFSALVSFTFNVGAGALSASTLLKRVNDKKFAEAANEFPKWRFAGGQEFLGLVRRRKAERALFLK